MVEIHLTVSNNGSGWVFGMQTALSIEYGAGVVTGLCCPSGGVASLPPGGSATWTWMTDEVSNGVVRFSASGSGDDQFVGPNIGERDAVSNVSTVDLMITPLRSSLAVVPNPTSVNGPTPFEVHLTVTNNGSMNVDSLLPQLWIESGAGNVSVMAGPFGGPASLGAGTAGTWTWQYDEISNGVVRFSASGSGDDQSIGPNFGERD